MATLTRIQIHTFYIHAPDRSTPLLDTLRGIDVLYREGAFERFGLSNFTTDEVEEVVKIALANDFVLPTAYQGHYSAISRKVEHDLFPVLRKHRMVFYAYSPQAGGFLAKTKAQLVESSIEGRWDVDSSAGNFFRSIYSRSALLDALDVWGQISADSNIPRAELAYRWIAFHSLLGQGDAIIFSASSWPQLDQTLDGVKQGPLPLSVVERIEKVWELVKEEAPLDHFNRGL